MRYYDLTLTQPGSPSPVKQWSSYPNGNYDSAALNIEFDMPILTYNTASGGQTITIHGISLQDLTQAYQFGQTPGDTPDAPLNPGATLVLKGGMKAGLPLVNPAQAGTIMTAQVTQAFGKWEGTEMTLDLVVYPSVYTQQNQGNLTLIWPAGERLSDSLLHCLQVAYPNADIDMKISPDYVNSFDNHHSGPTLEDLASFVSNVTTKSFNAQVYISNQNNKILVFDDTYQPGVIQLNFHDFIGQSTWIDVNTIQIKTVMRADLTLGCLIKMPTGLQNAPGFVTNSAAAFPSSIKYRSTFQNNFRVMALRQIGNFRSSDAGSWATLIQAVPA